MLVLSGLILKPKAVLQVKTEDGERYENYVMLVRGGDG